MKFISIWLRDCSGADLVNRLLTRCHDTGELVEGDNSCTCLVCSAARSVVLQAKLAAVAGLPDKVDNLENDLRVAGANLNREIASGVALRGLTQTLAAQLAAALDEAQVAKKVAAAVKQEAADWQTAAENGQDELSKLQAYADKVKVAIKSLS